MSANNAFEHQRTDSHGFCATHSDLVKCFIEKQLQRWPNVEALYGGALRQTKVFGSKGTKGVEHDIEEDEKHAKGDKRWKVLQDRIVEHVRILLSPHGCAYE